MIKIILKLVVFLFLFSGVVIVTFLFAAKVGNVWAEHQLGNIYARDGFTQDYVQAEKWYRRAAEQGDVDSQWNLGVMYDIGRGVVHNDKEAVKWYRLAAERGDAKAQNNLGWMYHEGQGVEKSYSMAMQLLQLAAKQGLTEAQNNIGEMYHALSKPRHQAGFI